MSTNWREMKIQCFHVNDLKTIFNIQLIFLIFKFTYIKIVDLIMIAYFQNNSKINLPLASQILY